ncbi:hypothetical protein KJ766_00120 [Patescibacteria group bacterium]|nr:hypothetical protein [Patescibacteria group bacterium]
MFFMLPFILGFISPILAEEHAVDEKKYVRLKDNKSLTVQKLLEKSKNKPTLLSVTTSQNCYCIMARCKASEPVIKAITDRFGDQITVITLDHYKQQAEFDSITETYPAKDLPALMLFDKGVLVMKQVGFTKKNELEIMIQVLLADQ